MIEFEDGAVQIDAEIVGEGLGVEPRLVQRRMQEGEITGFLEQGFGEDAGRHRLTFLSANRRLRLVIDDSGKILQRSVLDFDERARALRRSVSPRDLKGE